MNNANQLAYENVFFPDLFLQRSNRKGARRVSVHPQHLQRLSAVTSSSSNTLAMKSSTSPVEQKPRLASLSSTDPTDTCETAVESEKNISENVNMNDQTKIAAGLWMCFILFYMF